MNEDAEVPTENSPFGRVEMSIENDANTPSRPKGIRGWLAQSRVKWGIAILVAIVLLTVILVTTLLLIDTSTKFLKLWPRPNAPDNGLYFVHGSSQEWDVLTVHLDELYNNYRRMKHGSDVVQCKDGTQTKNDEVCLFDIESFGNDCTPPNNFGYDLGTPCIFLQFNKIKDWIPEPYTAQELKKYMNLSDKLSEELTTGDQLLYLDCQGLMPFDKESVGPLRYITPHGFQTKYFPYRGQEEYMPPLVGIKFVKPATGGILTITCQLWAKNVEHTDGIPNDQISFTLLVD